MYLFECPECHEKHAEPLEASFVLSVCCADCETALAIAAARGSSADGGYLTAA